LCDGTNGTPALRGRFIYGASIDAEVLTTGGSADAIVVGHDHTTPDHTHTASTDTGGEHTHAVNGIQNNGSFGPTGLAAYPGGPLVATGSAGSHSHAVTINNGGAGSTSTVGLSGTNANLPPYMYLAYIIKL
jgi:hypothetical protein